MIMDVGGVLVSNFILLTMLNSNIIWVTIKYYGIKE